MLYAIEFAGAGATVSPRTLAELARMAEGAGWDGVFLGGLHRSSHTTRHADL
jgi:alkanesulfonate monooxygenase SsuD/methylene tetrahydromethanopterin reductase-like flavin-dependent oxidoreductase (luciferase family)